MTRFQIVSKLVIVPKAKHVFHISRHKILSSDCVASYNSATIIMWSSWSERSVMVQLSG